MFHRIEFLLEDSKNSLSNNKNEILINSDVTLYLIYLLLEAKKVKLITNFTFLIPLFSLTII